MSVLGKLFMLSVASYLVARSWWNYLKHRTFTWVGMSIPRSLDRINLHFCIGVTACCVGLVVLEIAESPVGLCLFVPGVMVCVAAMLTITQENRRY